MTELHFSSEPGQSPGFLLWRVTLRWKRQVKAALDPLGLTHVQFVVLAGIAWHAKAGIPVTQAQLAHFIDADKMMTSQVIRALVARDLVTRAPNPDDGRAYLLELTDAARPLVTQAITAVEAADAAFFGALRGDQAALAGHLTRLLRS